MSGEAPQAIPKGYKQTEVGVIPEDWDVKKIGDLTTEVGDGIHSTPVYSSLGAYYFVNGNNIEKGSIVISDDTKRVDENEYKKHKKPLSLRTIFLSINGTIGNLAFYKNEPLVLGKSAAYLNVNERHSLEYVFYGLQTKSTNDFFSDGLTGSTIKNLGLGVIRETPIAVPSDGEEQTAIANALSDVDALITSLEKLIAKKRAIKTAAMQQLLTGKKRLPPFDQNHRGYKQTELGEIPEDWEVAQLGNLAHIRTGAMNNQDKHEDGAYPFFVRSQNVERINSYSYDCEAILVPGEGNIGNIFHYINGKFDAHQRVYVIRHFSDDCSGRYIYFCMKQYFGKHAMENSVKATVDSLRLPTFLEFNVAKPSTVDEQDAIASALHDLDSEVDALEHRLDKTQQLKQGMMQELLTGRTRLI